MDIVKLVSLGESQTLEFKRDTSGLESVLKAIVAFANTSGGIILIGVEDDGQIVGIERPDKIQEQLANAISNRIKPQLVPEFTSAQVDNKTVLCLQVDHIPEPYYLGDRGQEKGTYLRIGNTNQQATAAFINEASRASKQPFFDKSPCDQIKQTDLDRNLIDEVFSGRTISTEQLLTLGILVKKGRRIIASNAGVIMFGKPEVRLQHFPFAEVKCARFAGTSRAEFIDRLDLQGSIIAAINEVPKFIRRNTRMAGKFGEMRRRDIPEYPVEGVREALTNALVHANYEIPGTRIFVAIYDDRLEIQNPGIMPPGMDIEQFKAGVSRVRNPVIARVFKEMELVEEWGSGYRRIKAACNTGGYPEPKWEEFGTALRVTFFPHRETAAPTNKQLGADFGTQSAPSEHPVKLDAEVVVILKLCKTPANFQEIMKQVGWQDRTKFRRKYLHPLLAEHYLEMTIPEKPNSRDQQYKTSELGLRILDQYDK